MRKLLCSIALLVAVNGVFGQDKLVKKARDLMLENKLTEAQQELNTAMKSEKTKDFALAWDVQGDIYQRIFAAELNKAAAKQPLDTVAFAKNLFACIDAYEKCNSLDEKKAYVAKNKGNLMKFRVYYMYCGQFFFTNKQFKQAYDAYDRWLTFPQTYKLVAGEPSVLKDSTFDENQIAYYASLSAYQAKDYALVSRHLDRALLFKQEANTTKQLKLATLLELKDTANWIKSSHDFALGEGDNEYIAQNLLAYYQEKGDNAKALSFAEELIAVNPNNKIANYSKGVILFEEAKYMQALPFFKKVIEADPGFVDAYYNAGVCYCNEGYNVNEAIAKKKLKPVDHNKEIIKVKELYAKAEPFFVKVRELQPEKPARWASRLKTVYYITGNKAKEKEMDAYIK